MVQATLKTTTEAPVKVPIFVFTDGIEASELAEIFVERNPKYLINLSNSIEALKIHVKRNVENNVAFIMTSAVAEEVKQDYNLRKKVELMEVKELI